MPTNLRGPELLLILLGLLFLIAIVVVIVVVVRLLTRPAPTPTATAQAPRPPGWYPVPDGTGRVAWWDGQEWDNTINPPNAT